ncbi:MAG TPA: tetratricopeptide repeat protein [Roseiflexaceae bacterium]|nr:tetratricopeptide repeat protein [Roseiflexaceae bacterium]
MSKQDEKLRLRRRLQSQAVDLAARNRWQEAVDVNLQLLSLGEDTDTLNRLGKAYFELGRLADARDAYQRALRLTPNNPIARKNLERIEELLARSATMHAPSKTGRQLVDLRLFITETGKTALTTLIDVARGPTLGAIVTGERVELRLDGRNVLVYDVDGNLIGRIEPKLAQRLSELMAGGNRYAAAVAYAHGHQVRILVRETYQDPSQRGRVSFPGKLSEGAMRGYLGGAQYDEYGEEMLEEEEAVEEREEPEEEAFGGEEEELGLDDIEQDIGEEEDINEE